MSAPRDTNHDIVDDMANYGADEHSRRSYQKSMYQAVVDLGVDHLGREIHQPKVTEAELDEAVEAKRRAAHIDHLIADATAHCLALDSRPIDVLCQCGIAISKPAADCAHWQRSPAEASTELGFEDDERPAWPARGSYGRVLGFLLFVGLTGTAAVYLALQVAP
jgi:hypothetical protein